MNISEKKIGEESLKAFSETNSLKKSRSASVMSSSCLEKKDSKLKPILNYFLLPISRESIVWGSNFRNGDFGGFTRFEVP